MQRIILYISISFLCFLHNNLVNAQQHNQVNLQYLEPYTKENHQPINHTYFSILYSDEYKQAYCSYYHLYNRMSECFLHREDHFVCDSLVNGRRIKTSHYTNTGYDRGHLACQADMCFNKTAMNECFVMSNISPQVPGFNKGIWKKLEHQCRVWSQTKGDLFIFTGGVLKKDLKKISKDSISIPEHFYKIVMHHDSIANTYETIAFLIPNQDIDVYDLNDYIVSIDAVEEETKIDFFSKVPDVLEKNLEKRHIVGNWIINQ